MLTWTNNPERDADRYDLAMNQSRKMLPKCAICGEIIDADYVYVDDNGVCCEECHNKEYRVPMDDFLEI